MENYLMGDDFTDFSAMEKPKTLKTLTYAEWEANFNTKALQTTIKWLQTQMSTHDQQQIMLDQMTYDCIAAILTGDNWHDRLLQVLQHVVFLRSRNV
jgi:hypothetical protein